MILYNLQFFAKDGPGGEKTEPATPKKLEDARKKGQVAKSKELSSAVTLIGLFVGVKMLLSVIGTEFTQTFPLIYNKIPDYAKSGMNEVNSGTFSALISQVLIRILQICGPFFAVGVIVVVIIELVQVKWKISGEPMKPKFNKLNPASGLKKIFSSRSIFELAKSIAKVGLIAILAYNTLKDKAGVIQLFYEMTLQSALLLIGDIVLDMAIKIGFVYLILAFIDFGYEKYKFSQDMKMTKQEVKDEYKNSEGDPQIKGKIKQKMREASQRRMMKALPEADVVITNPTHLAVAIKYDAEQHEAPVVLAKGADFLAQKIKDVAKDNSIEIVENKPLARMLYYNVEIDEQIPPELYQAVAEVLTFVYNLKNKKVM